MKMKSMLLCLILLLGPVHFVSAQTGPTFKVSLLVSGGRKAKEKATTLKFSADSFAWLDRKGRAVIKEFRYADVVAAEYSFAERPLLTGRKARLTSLMLSNLALPVLLLKKNVHWLTIRTADDYTVMRLSEKNCQSVLDEFKTRKILFRNLGNEDGDKVIDD